MRPASLGLAFVLELAALAALAYWGWGVTWALAIAAPVAWIALWAVFGSPKARVKLSPSLHLAFEVVMFGSAAVALWAAGQPVWAVGFAAVLAVNRTLTAARYD
ncbi:MAG: YrdB family protein [Gaiellales bacterium]